MLPTLSNGDLVLVKLDGTVNPGDLVLVAWSTRPDQLSIKRAQWVEPDGWFVTGDNISGSTDSNHLGPATVLGVIRWRLWPFPGRVR